VETVSPVLKVDDVEITSNSLEGRQIWRPCPANGIVFGIAVWTKRSRLSRFVSLGHDNEVGIMAPQACYTYGEAVARRRGKPDANGGAR
jgi:hypothetical protein